MNTRHIAAEGAPNFRDLGGYPASAGKTVKWGKVFRSDDLYDLSDGGIETVAALGIRVVVDFRTRQETLMSPDRLPDNIVKSYNIAIDAGSLMTHYEEETLNARKTTGIMISVYRAFVTDFQPAYRQFFDLLANKNNIPLLFHCTAGKDRTGFAAALFFSALGVDRKIIMEDYSLSDKCLQEKYVEGVNYDSTTKPLFTVNSDYLQAAFDVIDNEYGNVESYLEKQLGVDIGYFRRTFTE